jgi:hypothetical protein
MVIIKIRRITVQKLSGAKNLCNPRHPFNPEPLGHPENLVLLASGGAGCWGKCLRLKTPS